MHKNIDAKCPAIYPLEEASPEDDEAFVTRVTMGWTEVWVMPGPILLRGVNEPITLVVHDFDGPVGLGWAVRRTSSRQRRPARCCGT